MLQTSSPLLLSFIWCPALPVLFLLSSNSPSALQLCLLDFPLFFLTLFLSPSSTSISYTPSVLFIAKSDNVICPVLWTKCDCRNKSKRKWVHSVFLCIKLWIASIPKEKKKSIYRRIQKYCLCACSSGIMKEIVKMKDVKQIPIHCFYTKDTIKNKI